jgi:hypothetical protein
MRDELKWKEVDEQNAAIKWGLFETDTPSEEGWLDVSSSARWPDLEVGVEVLSGDTSSSADASEYPCERLE